MTPKSKITGLVWTAPGLAQLEQAFDLKNLAAWPGVIWARGE